jgi:hypothetical protein
MTPGISVDRDRLRMGVIQEMLSKTFWSPGITEIKIAQGIRNSALVVGAYAGDGREAGFCRVISDKTRFAYLLDVVVAEDYRYTGNGQERIRFAVAHPDLWEVYQLLLKTSNAHGFIGSEGLSPSMTRRNGWR